MIGQIPWDQIWSQGTPLGILILVLVGIAWFGRKVIEPAVLDMREQARKRVEKDLELAERFQAGIMEALKELRNADAEFKSLSLSYFEKAAKMGSDVRKLRELDIPTFRRIHRHWWRAAVAFVQNPQDKDKLMAALESVNSELKKIDPPTG